MCTVAIVSRFGFTTIDGKKASCVFGTTTYLCFNENTILENMLCQNRVFCKQYYCSNRRSLLKLSTQISVLKFFYSGILEILAVNFQGLACFKGYNKLKELKRNIEFLVLVHQLHTSRLYILDFLNHFSYLYVHFYVTFQSSLHLFQLLRLHILWNSSSFEILEQVEGAYLVRLPILWQWLLYSEL